MIEVKNSMKYGTMTYIVFALAALYLLVVELSVWRDNCQLIGVSLIVLALQAQKNCN